MFYLTVLKISGLIFISFGICFFAISKADTLTKREKLMLDIINAIQNYKTAVLYSGKETKDILTESFSSIKGISFEGLTPVFSDDFPLKEEEKKTLINYIESAGKKTVRGENNNCDYYITLFKKYKTAAEKEAAQKRRIYIVGGVSLAFATVVLLI